MTRDEFISRADAVVEQLRVAFANFEDALREERRRYWLAFVDVFDQEVEEAAGKHGSKGVNPYMTLIGGALMVTGDMMERNPKNFVSGYGFSKLGDDISKGTDLVVRISPKDGIAMLESFKILEFPKRDWPKQDAEGRLLLTPAEFKSRMQELRREIRGMEEPWPLPVEMKQAETAIVGLTKKQN